MSDIINIIYYLFTAGVGFLLAFLLLKLSKIMLRMKNVEEVFGTEKIYVNNDLLLEMFQFCNFRTVGTNFCLVNRRWSQIGKWRCQNRPHQIPLLIVNVKEECYPRIAEKICWKKSAYLQSWHQDASVEKLANVPLEIPKNYEKIQTLHIEFPYDWNARSLDPDKKMLDFISACSAHMHSCRIHIQWNGVEALSSYHWTTFKELFLASISQLKEIHLVFESSKVQYSNRNSLYMWTCNWLLADSIDDKTPRKLYLIEINAWDIIWDLDDAKKKFLDTLEKMPIFDVLFLLEGGNTKCFEQIKIKNTKTGQIFYLKYQRIDGVDWVTMRLYSLEEAHKQFEFRMESTIQWNIHPGRNYIQMKEEMEENKGKMNPVFVDLLKD